MRGLGVGGGGGGGGEENSNLGAAWAFGKSGVRATAVGQQLLKRSEAARRRALQVWRAPCLVKSVQKAIGASGQNRPRVAP